MQETYRREAKILERTEEEKKVELILSILRAKRELDSAHKNFEYAEEDLIDYYTYQMKAMRSKLDYLLKKAKNQGIVLDRIHQIEIQLNEA